MSRPDLKYLIAFNQLANIGPVRLQRLLNYFPDLEKAWTAGLKDYLKAGLEEKIAWEIINGRKIISPEHELEKIGRHNIKVATVFDQDYPSLLKESYGPPPILYYYGNINFKKPLAVVGARKVTAYGRQITQDIVSDLSSAGLTIVSGLAFGVDAIAHKQALKNGRTVAVLGCGLGNIYPAGNKQLAQEILENQGCIISEFPVDMPALKHHFPQRNRIIAGLSLGVLVTQAAEKSGSLITAAFALEQNREVFAVPGPINDASFIGTNKLIQSGAKLVVSAADILQSLELENYANKDISLETKTEEVIYNLLKESPLHADKLSRLTKLDISTVNSTLVVLEMRGLVRHLGNQTYSSKI